MFNWTYFRNNKSTELSPQEGKILDINEIQSYIKNKNWLQADLNVVIKGIWYKIGHITCVNRRFLTFDHIEHRFIEIKISDIEKFVKNNLDNIINRQIYLH